MVIESTLSVTMMKRVIHHTAYRQGARLSVRF